MGIVKAENLSFSYEKQEKRILNKISFDVDKGDFMIIAGKSGCGKSTLLKLMKPEISPYGKINGSIKFKDREIRDYSRFDTSLLIGYVPQDIDAASVSETVWGELAFGLESLGLDNQTISGKISEISNFFGISNWFRKKISTLSGGQKQIVNLAASMVTDPEVLLLDEPTSMLDPIMRDTFFNLLKKINRELGVTIIIIEHNLESIFFDANKVLIISDDGTSKFGTPMDLVKSSFLIDSGINLPISIKLYYELGKNGSCPRSLVATSSYLKANVKNDLIDTLDVHDESHANTDQILKLKNVSFRYNKNDVDILNGLDFSLYKGEIVAIIGSNGVGKSTFLKVLSGLLPIYAGSYVLYGKKISKYRDKNVEGIAMLPQDPRGLFVEDTVKNELKEFLKLIGVKKEELAAEVEMLLQKYDLKKVENIHPYDISGGEAEKLALAKVLSIKPKILILDEPTQALDNIAKNELKDILLRLHDCGTTIVMVTHDLDFSSQVATRCVTFFDGKLIGDNNPNKFFSSKNIFTTDARRVSRDIYKNAVTIDDILKLKELNEK